MELSYTSEYIVNENGVNCRVLNIEAIGFENAEIGRKNKETIIMRANGGEKIDTVNAKGLIESTYLANQGDTIFYNNEKDIYIPRNSEGKAWDFNNIELYGYEVTSSNFEFCNHIAKKVKSTKYSKILHEVIDIPTCIKNAWEIGNHQFLFQGATIKFDQDNSRVTGIDKSAFDETWEIVNPIMNKREVK